MSPALRQAGRVGAALRASMAFHIWLSITVVAALLVAGSGFVVMRLTRDELRETGDLVMLANLAVVSDSLQTAHEDLEAAARTIVQRIEVQLGILHVALLDGERRTIVASSSYDVPAEALPDAVLPIEDLPIGVTPVQARRLQQRLGRLVTYWTAPDGRVFRLLVAELRPAGAARGGPVLAALALEVTQSRQTLMRGDTVVLGAVLLSMLAAGVMGLLIARRIVVSARKLGEASSRISAQALTERLQIEHAPTELRASAQAFNLMLDRLEASFRRLSQFTSDIAHDLRTPINNLLGEAQVALARPRSAAEYRQVLESAVEDYERISRLIENMLFLARAEDPQASIRRDTICLRMASERLRDYFEALADERGVTVACRADGESPQVWADKTLLLRALGNLIANALRYATAGSTVEVHASPAPDGGCTISVSNAGPAIPLAEQQRIFERLYRIDPSREGSAAGSGLGLAIVKSIMDLHGGRVTLSSTEGERTVFSLWFPPPPAA